MAKKLSFVLVLLLVLLLNFEDDDDREDDDDLRFLEITFREVYRRQQHSTLPSAWP